MISRDVDGGKWTVRTTVGRNGAQEKLLREGEILLKY